MDALLVCHTLCMHVCNEQWTVCTQSTYTCTQETGRGEEIRLLDIKVVEAHEEASVFRGRDLGRHQEAGLLPSTQVFHARVCDHEQARARARDRKTEGRGNQRNVFVAP